MIKCCRYCKFCYCADESDVSGLSCSIQKWIKIVNPEILHPYCGNFFRFSLLKFLFGI